MKRLAGELTYYMIRPCKLICFLEKREKKKKKKGPTMGGGGEFDSAVITEWQRTNLSSWCRDTCQAMELPTVVFVAFVILSLSLTHIFFYSLIKCLLWPPPLPTNLSFFLLLLFFLKFAYLFKISFYNFMKPL